VSLVPALLSMAGILYAAGAVLLGAYFLYAGLQVARTKTLTAARAVLLASVIYLPALYGLMLIG
jgi:protoheme IX farnesyltransferase